ncbi:MAG: tetratricopeptide repeat protein [Pyrinomonadaceae bacterium]
MKQIFTFIGVMSLALAGCGGLQDTANSVEPIDGNAAAAESQFAYITDANLALAEGNRLLDENQTETAIEALRQAVKLNPDLAEAHFKLGIAYSLLDMQMEQAGVVTEEPASNTNSKESRKKTNAEKAFGKAVDAYKKWIENNPKDDAAYFNLGRTYAKLAKDEEAEKAFKEAVKLKPEDADYQIELGSILIKLAQYREAITALKNAIELDETNARAQDLLDDAEAGRQRVDYSPPKNTNQAANKNSNSESEDNSNSSSNSKSNTAAKAPESNTKPKVDNTKKPPIPANKPKQR